TTIDLMVSAGPADEAARALGFKYLDETRAWFMKWSAADWSKTVDEDDDEDDEDVTPGERAQAERDSFIGKIDAREGVRS
ncbi:MAG TPA: hypothetical protein VM029_22085, partial [Opitutaceae bacterium]|nr:hypothetical protein [Opitutaceae bacterium]